eukprot:TRINITY_DN1428_c0_g1_i3.p1 TRINITY_DN1428_c0_g1~~TRINITY_DN1428_c0_g1_i3.p1  ORF type:complete len:1095 (-),score=216.73 TRINITY_DN1428_c0_g1_i3:804-3977(-)
MATSRSGATSPTPVLRHHSRSLCGGVVAGAAAAGAAAASGVVEPPTPLSAPSAADAAGGTTAAKRIRSRSFRLFRTKSWNANNSNSGAAATTAESGAGVGGGALSPPLPSMPVVMPEMEQGEELITWMNGSGVNIYVTNYRMCFIYHFQVKPIKSAGNAPAIAFNNIKDASAFPCARRGDSSNSGGGSEEGRQCGSGSSSGSAGSAVAASFPIDGLMEQWVPLACIASAKWKKTAKERTCTLRCKDFRSLLLRFNTSQEECANKFEELLERLVFPGTATGLFAFSYGTSVMPTTPHPKGAGDSNNGWQIYDAVTEYKRLGIPNTYWRISDINYTYERCPSYPSLVCVPAATDDKLLNEAAEFRTSFRFPVVTWRHPISSVVIARSSQPKVGLRYNRCEADELLLRLVRTSNPGNMGKMCIVDCRPRMNAMANQTMGAGTEEPSFYDDCTVLFLNIENIHAMRDSSKKLRDLIATKPSNLLSLVRYTKWLSHIHVILQGACLVVEHIEKMFSVLVHCSDGWDRTPQITSLALLMLDPYYRTVHGFEVLIEKEWLSYGHKFATRVGQGQHECNEQSPVFLQFLECVYHLLLLFPVSFEFNSDFILAIADNLYSCKYGTFLCDCHLQRKLLHLKRKTVSLWTALNGDLDTYTNTSFMKENHPQPIPKADSFKILQLWASNYQRFSQKFLCDNVTWAGEAGLIAIMNKYLEKLESLQESVASKIQYAVVLGECEASEDDEQQCCLKTGQHVRVVDSSNNEKWLVVPIDDPTAPAVFFPKTLLQAMPDIFDGEGGESRPPASALSSSRTTSSAATSPQPAKLTGASAIAVPVFVKNSLLRKRKHMPSISVPFNFIHQSHVSTEDAPAAATANSPAPSPVTPPATPHEKSPRMLRPPALPQRPSPPPPPQTPPPPPPPQTLTPRANRPGRPANLAATLERCATLRTIRARADSLVPPSQALKQRPPHSMPLSPLPALPPRPESRLPSPRDTATDDDTSEGSGDGHMSTMDDEEAAEEAKENAEAEAELDKVSCDRKHIQTLRPPHSYRCLRLLRLCPCTRGAS